MESHLGRRHVTEYVEGRKRDLRVRAPDLEVENLWVALSRVEVPQPWIRDDETARKWQDDCGPARQVFRYPDPNVGVFVVRRPWGLEVPNIVFSQRNQVSSSDYNTMAKRFADDVLSRVRAEIPSISIELGPVEHHIEDVAHPSVVEALRRFSRMANKATGNAHPLDNERWRLFVRTAHETMSSSSTGSSRKAGMLTPRGGSPSCTGTNATFFERNRLWSRSQTTQRRLGLRRWTGCALFVESWCSIPRRSSICSSWLSGKARRLPHGSRRRR